jgi:hypothetical protein
VDDADVGVVVPSEHGADGFIEFGAAVFVDAAGVGPGKTAAVQAGFRAEEEEFVQAGTSGDIGDADGESVGEYGLVKSSINWDWATVRKAVGGDARGHWTYLVILDQRIGECADHGHILERRFAVCKPSMRKYGVFDELEDGVSHVTLRRVLTRWVFLEMGDENEAVVPSDIGPRH